VYYAELLDVVGREEQAIAEMKHGLSLNPFWMDHNVAFGYLLVRLRQYDAAIEQFRKTLELDSNYVSAWLWLAEAQAYKGDQGAALEARLEALTRALLPNRVAEVGTRLERVYSRSGWSGFWRSELALAEEDLGHPGTVWKESWARLSNPFAMARRYTRLGEWDRALAALEQAYEERYVLMPFVQREPLFEPLRKHRRYQDLILRMGLPPA
jgi:tetratricopeptide (TPR) repeat protein